MEVKTIREGGNNGTPDPADRAASRYGTADAQARHDARTSTSGTGSRRRRRDPALRADAEVVLLAADGADRARALPAERCLPVKLKAPPLNAKDGMVAIEELQIAYESLSLKRRQRRRS